MYHIYVFTCGSYINSANVLAIYDTSLKENVLIVVISIYSSCLFNEKRERWEAIVSIKRLHTCRLWCIFRDFNAVRRLEERRGRSLRGSNKKQITKFNKFINELQMYDIPIVRWKFTWYRLNEITMSRLDNF